MADPPLFPDTSDDTDSGYDRGSTTGAPRWVQVFGIIVVALILLFVILQLTRIGGHHGPGRHLHSGLPGRAPASGTGDGG
jgi:hypothetical protein